MASKGYDESDGVWRTIGGRRVFIRDGEDLVSAMKRSGKFKSNSKAKEALKKIGDTDIESLKNLSERAKTKTLSGENEKSKRKSIDEVAEDLHKELDQIKSARKEFDTQEKRLDELAKETGFDREEIFEKLKDVRKREYLGDPNYKMAYERSSEKESSKEKTLADVQSYTDKQIEEGRNPLFNKKEQGVERLKDQLKKKEKYDYLQVDDEYKSKQFADMSENFQKNLESKYGKQQADQINKSAEEYVQNKTAGKINKALRSDSVERLKDKETIKKTIEDIDKAIDSYQTEQNIRTVRFEDGTNLMKHYGVDLSKFDTDNINNVPKSKLAKEFEKHIGSEYSSKSYTSTSATKTGSAGFTDLPFRMEIDVPKGTNAFVTKNKDEHEIILARNQKLVLKGVDYEPWSSSLMKDVNPKVADTRGKVVLKYEVQNTSSSDNKAYKNAFEQYKKQHPNSKLTLNKFIDMSEGK